MWKWTEDGLDRAITLIQNGMKIIGENELFYIALGIINMQYINFGIKKDKKYLQEAIDCAEKVFVINSHSSQGHFLNGFINLWNRESPII